MKQIILENIVAKGEIVLFDELSHLIACIFSVFLRRFYPTWEKGKHLLFPRLVYKLIHFTLIVKQAVSLY